jgi:hypothetical protein
MSDQTEQPTEGEGKTRKPIERTNPVVEFVSEIPTISRGAGGFMPRKSKYDAVYAALKENPGRWAYIGEGDGLYGALTGYRKRRELEDMTIANRGGKVYAGVGVEVVHANSEDDSDEGDAEGNGEDAATQPADGAHDAGMQSPSGDTETPQNAAPVTVPADDAWA